MFRYRSLFSCCSLILALLLPSALRCQLKPMGQVAGVKRAVVIGVSKFQNEHIPPLQYAHADATAFATFLQSKAGGSLPDNQLKLLTNEQATQGQMAAALTWLMDESKEGDTAIIYFSGHGDMETKTMANHGFLLTYDAPAATYMAGGAFPVFYLQSVLQTLSTQKKVQVMLVTDACHAGKLAGSANQGTQATAQLLAEQFANEARLLSCQPNEYSEEGAHWGGGHGVFTYFLLDGLMGLADANQDGSVTLLELQRYLEDEVPRAVSPKSQIPLVFGNKGMKVATVDAPTLAALQDARTQLPDEAVLISFATASRSAAVDRDSSVLLKYRQFQQALAQKHLLYPEEGSAYQLFLDLADQPAVATYYQDMRRNLAAALQDEAQQAINDYLAANPAELRRRWSQDTHYEQYPEYLNTAAALQGASHFSYQDLKNKALYFSGVNYRLQGEREQREDLYLQAEAIQQQVVALDSTAIYAYNELGLLARRTGDYQGSIAEFQKALAYSPTWVLAQTNLCGSYRDVAELDLAKSACQKALQYDSTFALAYHNLGAVLKAEEQWATAIQAYQKALEYAPDYAETYRGLGEAYYFEDSLAQAKTAWEAYLDLDPLKTDILYNLGYVTKALGQNQEARQYFQAVVGQDSSDWETFLEIADLEIAENHYEQAASAIAYAQRLAQEAPDTYYLLASLQAQQKEDQVALAALQLALDKGFTNYARIQQDPAWNGLRDTRKFKALLKQIQPPK
ncbi:MAG: hypothetical protein DA408_20230 [Bacteroidetes bacterium]|nr:MAG: hypothetical protein DA408_20230 [Bacteroidota bacterium]